MNTHKNTKANTELTDRFIFSVIIPCYNNSSTIQRALKSVFKQTYTNYEIIVIDDASNDVDITERYINNFNDERIKLIKHEANKNGSAARNTGIKAAKGDYIAFLDADDEWLPNHLKDALSYIASPSGQLCFCKSILKTEKHKDLVLPGKEINKNQRIGEYLFTDSGFIPTPTIVYDCNLIKTLFNEQLIRHQDYDFLLQVEAAGHKIGMSPHTGAIVHWENNDPAAKGGTWQYSLKWAKDNKHLLGKRAFANFLHKHCITPLLVQKKRAKAINLFFTNAVFLYLPLKQWAFFISYLIWGRVVFSRIKK